MRIEIMGGFGAIGVSTFQTDFEKYIRKSEDVISTFKAIKTATYNICGGVSDTIQNAIEHVEERIREESEKIQTAIAIQKKSNDFVDLVERVDSKVATLVNKNKDAFYDKYPHLKPVEPKKEKTYGYILGALCSAGDALQDFGEKVVDGVQKAVDWTRDTLKKAKDAIVEFWDEHWETIINVGVTVLCAVVTIAISVALAPVTGGASAILLAAALGAGSGAITSAVCNVTSQIAAGATLQTLDWGAVGKDAIKGAIIGGISGAISAGISTGMTNVLGKTGLGQMLNSTSAFKRATAGFIIGSTSEVTAGAASRGGVALVEETYEYATTGDKDFSSVFEDALNPKEMVKDAILGGTGEAIKSAKTKPASVADGASANDTPDIDANATTAPEVDVNGNNMPDVDGGGTTPDVDISSNNTPDIDISNGGTPDIDIGGNNMPDVDISSNNMPDVDVSNGGTPDVDIGGNNTPDVDISNNNMPDVDISNGGAPDIDIGANNVPDVDISGNNMPDVDISNSGTPDIDTNSSIPKSSSGEYRSYTKTEFSGELTYTDPMTKQRITVETNRTVYQNKNIDPNFVIPEGTTYPNNVPVKPGTTNMDLMKNGQAPFVIVTNSDGTTSLSQLELHHLTGQETLHGNEYFNGTQRDGSMVEIPATTHDDYNSELHIYSSKDGNSFRKDVYGNKSADAVKYEKFKEYYWKQRAESFN